MSTPDQLGQRADKRPWQEIDTDDLGSGLEEAFKRYHELSPGPDRDEVLKTFNRLADEILKDERYAKFERSDLWAALVVKSRARQLPDETI